MIRTRRDISLSPSLRSVFVCNATPGMIREIIGLIGSDVAQPLSARTVRVSDLARWIAF